MEILFTFHYFEIEYRLSASFDSQRISKNNPEIHDHNSELHDFPIHVQVKKGPKVSINLDGKIIIQLFSLGL